MSQGLALEFAMRGPWVTRFRIGDSDYGGDYDPASDGRLTRFRQCFPIPGRVVDLGCLEGGFTFEIAKSAEEVLGIDGRTENLDRARFVGRLLGVGNASFLEADLENFDFLGLGSFDVTFNVGLLYHLNEPWRLLANLADRSHAMFLWTHVAAKSTPLVQRGGYWGIEYAEFGRADPLSGLQSTSFWPTLPELRRMLADVGFGRTQVLDLHESHVHGPAVTLTALKGPRPRLERVRDWTAGWTRKMRQEAVP